METNLKIKLFSYDHSLLDKSVRKIIEIARNNDCGIKGPVPLPTHKELFTILRAPNAEKAIVEQFERKTHKRLIVLTKTTTQALESLKRVILPSGVSIKLQLIS
ncbi:MAG: 30S ribosomal protein S10 [Mycoplasmataceae bacterium]|jgi:small subunit ribosomal protein S10|nr:30S ribosomal protein S10 [Mycoplasmataceae bacterium]